MGRILFQKRKWSYRQSDVLFSFNLISTFIIVQFYLDTIELVRPLQSLAVEEFFPRGDRYDGLRACIGESMCLDLHKLRVFMVGAGLYQLCKCIRWRNVCTKLTWMFLLTKVGCGAIGCEMLKNFALLGVGLAKSSGEVGVFISHLFFLKPFAVAFTSLCKTALLTFFVVALCHI